jgi:iron complex outermembrane recepter protein
MRSPLLQAPTPLSVRRARGIIVRVLCVSIAAALCVVVAPVGAQAAIRNYELNIQRQPLETALQDFAHQTGLQIARFSDTIDGHALVGPLAGAYSAEQALDVLLVPHGLTYRLVNERTIAVMQPSVAGADATGARTSAGDEKPATTRGTPKPTTDAGWFRRLVLAQADTTPGAASSSASTASGGKSASTTSAGEGGLAQVIVTATKQSAIDVNKVPISISAYGQEEMDTRGVKNIADIAAITPGLNFSQQNNFGTPLTNIEIRGIQSRTSAPTTAIYIDDTPLVGRANNVNIGANGAYPQVFDLDRVEVLRGPQGTLFGASSEGGAVRFISKQPSLTESSLYARTEGADTTGGDATYEGGIAMGGPIVESTLGFRASAWYRREGGWVDRVQPPVGAGAFTTAIDPARPGGDVIESNANWAETKAAKVAFTWAPTDWLQLTPSVFYQRVYNHDSGNYDLHFSDPSNGHFEIAHSQRLPANDPSVVSVLKAEANRADLTFTSITSNYQRRLQFHTDYTQYQDYAFFGNPWPLTGQADDFGTGNYETDQNVTSEEFRVSSSSPSDRFVWVAGVYYEHAKQADTVYVTHPNLPALVLANFGVPIEQVLGVGPYLGEWVAYDEVHTTDKSVALFGNVDFKLTPHLTLTAGGRWSQTKSHTSLRFDGPFNGGPGFFEGDEEDTPFTPKLGATWQPDDASTYYVSIGKGYRVGGVNPQTNNTQPGCQSALATFGLTGKLLQTYDPDSLWSYEIGAKNRLLGNRLEIQTSAYHIKWSNIQQAAQITGCGFAAVFNLGTAVSNGFDLSLRAQVTDSFDVGLQLAYTDAHYTSSEGKIVSDGDVIGGPAISTGAAIPPWTVTGSVQYTFPMFGRSGYVWAEDAYHNANNGPFSTHEPANIIVFDTDLVPDRPSNSVNFRTGLRLANADVSLFVNNVANAHPQLSFQHTNPGDPRFQAVTLRPRTVGLTATFRY